MIHLIVLAAALLHLQDPAGDAVGDGSLVPPTAPVYANTSDFDLQGVEVADGKDLTVRVTMGALTDSGGLPNGFSSPVIEVYLDTRSGGSEALLPGSGMTMPPNHGWNIALRVSGDEAFAVEAQPQGSPVTWPRLPVTVDVQGTTIVLHTAIPRPEHVQIYALVGVYDPFRQDAWRPLSTKASPWAFSSATQHVPVVDLLAAGHAAQRRAIDSGVLVPYRSPMPGVGWLVLAIAGLVMAAFGAVVRRRVRPPVPSRDAGTAGPEVPGYQRFLDEAEEPERTSAADANGDPSIAEHGDAEERDSEGDTTEEGGASGVEEPPGAGAEDAVPRDDADVAASEDTPKPKDGDDARSG